MLGPFELSGLPEMYRGSWNNAAQIINLDATYQHPIIPGVFTSISLTTTSIHTIEDNTCTCEGYQHRNLCAHLLAVAYKEGRLLSMLSNVKLPSVRKLTNTSTIINSGKKPGRNVRKRISGNKKLPPNRAHFRPVVQIPSTSDDNTEVSKEVEFIFIRFTKAMVCHGCKGSFRASLTAPSMPPPYDLLVRARMHRCFRDRNTGKIRFTLKPEPTYFHLSKKCCLNENVVVTRDNHIILTPHLLLPCHKAKLKSEFSITA